MARKKKAKPDEGGPAGAPDWMVTFSDCMTLLLTFFVLLLSFSSFDEKLFRDTMVVLSKEFSLGKNKKDVKKAILPANVIKHDKKHLVGSEKTTLIKGEKSSVMKEERETEDFHDRKIFLIPSNDIFVGRGNLISPQGKKTLAEMAQFIKEIPNRIVISENPLSKFGSNENSGLQRAWAVTEYLTTKQGLDKQQFSISAASTVAGSNHAIRSAKQPERILEIVFLERSIYN